MWEGEEQFPLVITVFSAPNYCGSYQNKAAIAISSNGNEEQLQIKQFTSAVELIKPYCLP
jgi:serine/threonine-protein phosphatase 2B catalytic subunit